MTSFETNAILMNLRQYVLQHTVSCFVMYKIINKISRTEWKDVNYTQHVQAIHLKQ